MSNIERSDICIRLMSFSHGAQQIVGELLNTLQDNDIFSYKNENVTISHSMSQPQIIYMNCTNSN